MKTPMIGPRRERRWRGPEPDQERPSRGVLVALGAGKCVEEFEALRQVLVTDARRY